MARNASKSTRQPRSGDRAPATDDQQRARGKATRRLHKPDAPGAVPGPATTKLNARQLAFVAEYLKDHNATAAYQRAGYTSTGHTAESAASRLLSHVEVQRLIKQHADARIEQVVHETGITLERTLREIGKVAFHDPRQFFREDGSLKLPTELDDATAAALAGFEVEELFAGSGEDRVHIVQAKKVKQAEKGKYLDMLMRHLGGYERDKEKPTDLASTLAAFVGQLHDSGAGRLQFTPPRAKA